MTWLPLRDWCTDYIWAWTSDNSFLFPGAEMYGKLCTGCSPLSYLEKGKLMSVWVGNSFAVRAEARRSEAERGVVLARLECVVVW